MTQVPASQPTSRDDFNARLHDCLLEANEGRIGDPAVPKYTPWVFVRHGGHTYRLNADTKRDAVREYLALVAAHGDGLEWVVVPNQNGRLNAVGFGSDRRRIRGLNLYLHGDA
jgi:hypothetical protein